MNKQKIIEKYIDNQDKIKMGKELNALLFIEARQSYNKREATMFIKEFSESLGFKFHLDTAIRIIKYVYPEKKSFWSIHDKLYIDIIKNSAWLKYASKV